MTLNEIQRLHDEYLKRKIIERIQSIDRRQWIAIEHKFNRWEFPVEFYNLIPKWWKGFGDDQHHDFISPVCNFISNNFNNKEKLEYHNVWNGCMTLEEFEYWWNTRNTIKNTEYYHKRSNIQKIKWWEDDVYNKLSELNLW